MMNEKVLNEARLLIAGFIKERRQELGITQIELAERCNVGVNTIRRLEDGRFWINLKQLLIICHELQLYFFVEGKDSKQEAAEMMRNRWGKPGKN